MKTADIERLVMARASGGSPGTYDDVPAPFVMAAIRLALLAYWLGSARAKGVTP